MRDLPVGERLDPDQLAALGALRRGFGDVQVLEVVDRPSRTLRPSRPRKPRCSSASPSTPIRQSRPHGGPAAVGPDQRYMKNGLLEPRKAAVLDFTEDLPLRGVELLLGEQPLGEESPELVQPVPWVGS